MFFLAEEILGEVVDLHRRQLRRVASSSNNLFFFEIKSSSNNLNPWIWRKVRKSCCCRPAVRLVFVIGSAGFLRRSIRHAGFCGFRHQDRKVRLIRWQLRTRKNYFAASFMGWWLATTRPACTLTAMDCGIHMAATNTSHWFAEKARTMSSSFPVDRSIDGLAKDRFFLGCCW